MKEQIQQRLDEQNLKDLKAVLSTEEGRRFFSWLMQKCKQEDYEFKGNSRDTVVWGMRNVGKILETACMALDILGVDLMHQAEKEYILLQKDIAEDIKHEHTRRK